MKKHIIVQTAPAVRVSISEPFSNRAEDISTGQLVTALKRLGFDAVFDTNFGAEREEMAEDVDYVLTTRELVSIIKSTGMDFLKLNESDYDPLLGVSSGAANIFGTTGGVMEAALRKAHELITGKKLKKIDFNSVRGLEGIKQAEIEIDGLKLKTAVAHGLGNAGKLMEMIKV